MERKNYLTGKAFRMFFGASILTALSAMLGNIVDGMIVSHLIDYNAMSAISLSRPIIQGNYTVYLLFGFGASILVAKAMGQGDSCRVNSLFSVSLTLLFCISLVESLLGALFPDFFVNVLCTNQALHPYARGYFVPLIVGAPLFYLVYFCGAFTAIDGAPRLVSRAMVIDNIVNLCMDVVLIKVFALGIMGSSIATLIGHATAVTMMGSRYFLGKSHYHFPLTSKPSSLALIGEAVNTGLPFALESACLTIYLYSTQAIIGHGLGKESQFVFSVMLSIMTIYNMFVSGSCQTMQQLSALQIGMGDNYGHRLTVFTAFRFMNTCLAIACAVLVLCPWLMARMFACPDNLLSECCYGVRIYGFAFWLFCNMYLLMVNYKLLKRTTLSGFISYTLSLSVIPVMWLTVTYCPELVWWSNLIAYLIVFVLVIVSASFIHKGNKQLIPVLLLSKTHSHPQLDFSFDYSPEAMHSSFNELSHWLKGQDLNDSVVFKVRVIAEELMSNITRHSEQKNKKAFADVRVMIDDKCVVFSLSDDGTPFNPIENKDKGYGLMIANGASDEISYKYQFGQNMTVVKVKI